MDKNLINKYSKVRRIRSVHSNDRGTLFTDKNQSDGFVEFESLTEEGLFLLLDHDPNCTNIESQPVKIKNEKGKGNPYIPDAWARFKDGTESIFDVKHHTFFNSIKNNPEKARKWESRKKCIKTYCDKNQLLYQIVTSDEIFSNRLNNIQIFRKNKKVPEFEQRYARFWRKLSNFLKINSGLHVSGVAREGSRRKGTHKDRSDLDVIFAISGNPSKREIYPSLVKILTSGMNVQARIGSSYNAIKIQKKQLRCDIVLRTQKQFQTQINNREFEEI